MKSKIIVNNNILDSLRTIFPAIYDSMSKYEDLIYKNLNSITRIYSDNKDLIYDNAKLNINYSDLDLIKANILIINNNKQRYNDLLKNIVSIERYNITPFKIRRDSIHRAIVFLIIQNQTLIRNIKKTSLINNEEESMFAKENKKLKLAYEHSMEKYVYEQKVNNRKRSWAIQENKLLKKENQVLQMERKVHGL